VEQQEEEDVCANILLTNSLSLWYITVDGPLGFVSNFLDGGAVVVAAKQTRAEAVQELRDRLLAKGWTEANLESLTNKHVTSVAAQIRGIVVISNSMIVALMWYHDLAWYSPSSFLFVSFLCAIVDGAMGFYSKFLENDAVIGVEMPRHAALVELRAALISQNPVKWSSENINSVTQKDLVAVEASIRCEKER
jgi:hypothetical protein